MLKEIEFSKLIENDYNPRKRFDDAAMKDLQNSIGRIGLLEPLVVRSVDGGKFEVVCGVRRLKALHALSWKEKVPCNVVKADDKQAQIFSISENTARNDLTPIEQGRAYAGYVRGFNVGAPHIESYPSPNHPDVKDLSGRIGVSADKIAHRILLLSLPREVRTMVDNKELLLKPARAITRLRRLENRSLAKVKMTELATLHKGFSPDMVRLTNTIDRFLEESEKEEKEKGVVLEEAGNHLRDTLESLLGFNLELAGALKKRKEDVDSEGLEEDALESLNAEIEMLEGAEKSFLEHSVVLTDSLREEAERELDLEEVGEEALEEIKDLRKYLNAEIASIGSEELNEIDTQMAEVEVRVERLGRNIDIVKEEHPERCPFCQAGIALPDLEGRAETANGDLRNLTKKRDALDKERGGLQDLLKNDTKRVIAYEAAKKALDSLKGE